MKTLDFAAAVRAATNLDDLLDVLRNQPEELTLAEERLLASLPTFGGESPSNTDDVWSWDARRLLVGDSQDDMRIVSRSFREGEFV